MVERKPVTKKPTWLLGVTLPTFAGIPVGILAPSAASIGWYVMIGWQVTFAGALIFERAPVYGATSIPQARRLCELYGLKWLGLAALTYAAMSEVGSGSASSLANTVMAINLICTYSFSLAAGPMRLVNANDTEMKLVPTNCFLVAWAATNLYLISSSDN